MELSAPRLTYRSLDLEAPDLHELDPRRPASIARQLRKRAKRQVDLDEPAKPTAASFFIPTGSLLGMPTNSTLTLFSGLLPSAPANVETDAHLFFLLVRNRHIADRERLVIWFNGGPGCSSFDGALMEIGPFRLIEGTQTLKEIDGAWNEYANVLFGNSPSPACLLHETLTPSQSINLPARAIATSARTIMCMSWTWCVILCSVTVLRSFARIGSKSRSRLPSPLLRHLPRVLRYGRAFDDACCTAATIAKLAQTYLAGESYAGQYIPYIADAILKTTLIQMPLKGLLIGNGWIDPWYQYPAYMPFSYSTGVIKEGTSQAKRVEDIHAACMNRLGNIGYANYGVKEGTCESILGTIIDTTVQTCVVNARSGSRRL